MSLTGADEAADARSLDGVGTVGRADEPGARDLSPRDAHAGGTLVVTPVFSHRERPVVYSTPSAHQSLDLVCNRTTYYVQVRMLILSLSSFTCQTTK